MVLNGSVAGSTFHNMEESAKHPGAPDFDVYEAMDWKDGVGTLPGSELKVCNPWCNLTDSHLGHRFILM